ncbi:U4/U6 snRNA-associated-splicing factor, putative [Plasmodium ovale]|uniref:U4/U6 snRNA-associated-splicing factor, putative n=2 Tax=Plasmodium ovale TaxID=36330 RepID=A0A1D3U7T3_PLAOA|nr:U4/U6 snRNA-associated-splicing factor, putative (PRP24) [Plasmodium ovale curtisi]SBS92014.1 U4/U6 snRNA-associated-splicing factor, putative (PRP24) [Plasmodium ovale curtisi]SCQ16196.1 U4/U6 snRNA-associated-splicing factor, putative [Plasmodium ovale]
MSSNSSNKNKRRKIHANATHGEEKELLSSLRFCHKDEVAVSSPREIPPDKDTDGNEYTQKYNSSNRGKVKEKKDKNEKKKKMCYNNSNESNSKIRTEKYKIDARNFGRVIVKKGKTVRGEKGKKKGYTIKDENSGDSEDANDADDEQGENGGRNRGTKGGENGSGKHNANTHRAHTKHFLIENASDKSLLLKNLTAVEENKLYVKNVTEDITKEDLQEYFSNILGYVDTRIIFSFSGKSKKFAYVEFDCKENAANFLNTLQSSNVPNFKMFTLKNTNLYTCISNPQKVLFEEKKVFLKFVKCNIDNDEELKDQVKNFFSTHAIDIRDMRLLGEGETRHGYVELPSNDDVVKCVEIIGKGITEGAHFNLNYCIPIIKKKTIADIDKIKTNKEKNKQLMEEKRKEENNCTIVVKNLHFNTRKHKLMNFFQQIGEIENIHLSKKVSEKNIKRNRGYAFITFKNPNDATSSLILNESIIDGRNILISKFIDDNNMKNDFEKKDIHRVREDTTANYGTIEHTQKKCHVWDKFTHEKKRINLSKSVDSTNADVVEKRTDEMVTPMTNEDFRKFFFK